MVVSRWLVVRLAVCVVLALTGLGMQAISASAALQFEFKGAFGPDGTELSEFEAAGSVAIDRGDEVAYVLDHAADALYKFDLDGNPVPFGGVSPNLSGNQMSGLSIGGLRGESQVAVDSTTHTIYLTGEENAEGYSSAVQAFQANGDPAFFSAGPGEGTNQISGFPALRGVAVDLNGNIYAATAGPGGGDVKIFASTGAVIISTFGAAAPSGPANIAVNSKGVLYVLRNGTRAARYVPSEYPVTSGTKYAEDAELLDPNTARGIAVDQATNTVYVAEEAPVARVAVFDELGAEEGGFGGPGKDGELGLPEGVAPFSSGGITKVLVADTPEFGPSQVKIFEEEICICPPEIQSLSVSNVSADSATLRARINPNNLNTTYWFEYGVENCAVAVDPCAKVPALGGSISPGKKGVTVEQSVTGLQAGSEYFYRVVAENSEGKNSSSKTFKTQGVDLSVALGDSRAWEMVSPPQKFGGRIVNTDSTVVQASTTEDKLVYASLGSIVENPVSNRVPEPATLLAEREADGNWTNSDLTPTHGESSSFLHGQTEFKIFTPDLLRAEMEPSDNFPLSPEASERTPYLWIDGEPASFTPLVNPSNVPPGTKFGPSSGTSNPIRIEGANADLSHIVLRSTQVALVSGAGPQAIYMWSNGILEPISELPESDGGGVVNGMLGSGQGSVRNAVSSDGSRAFWTPNRGYNGTEFNLKSLYVRDTVAGESSRLDIPLPDASGTGVERPAFNGASADGSVVFFTDSQQLTKDASSTGRDLYRCEVGPVGEGLGCVELTDISAPIEGSGESAEVLNQVSALSEDGSRVFFVGEGVLDEGPNEEGETAEAGDPNLYYWQEGEGTRFIARLSDKDSLVWGELNTRGYTINISATVSPQGRYFAFTSEKSLTGYENRNDAGEPNTEVFLFDTEAGADQLTCVSCNPSGASAVGEKLSDKVAFFPPDRGSLWAGRSVAATLPEASQAEPSGPSLYRPRSVLDNGRVFFNSVDPLVRGDGNGNWDVYQYEPTGLGTCTEATNTGTVTRSGNGCVGLISSGTSAGAAGFLDATPSGNDVFFLTQGRLSVFDQDDEVDVYDARVNGVTAVKSPVSECTGEGCQAGAIGPSDDPTPASQTFSGNSTPLRCRKGQRKVRRHGKAVCVRKKKHHKKKHHKPAGKNRRASR